MSSELLINGGYIAKYPNINISVLILGQEPSPHEMIYHIAMFAHTLHINFLPVHIDQLNKIEFVGMGKPNMDSYTESLKIWVDTCDKAYGEGFRTFFTINLEEIFKTGYYMYGQAKELGKDYMNGQGLIVLPCIFPAVGEIK